MVEGCIYKWQSRKLGDEIICYLFARAITMTQYRLQCDTCSVKLVQHQGMFYSFQSTKREVKIDISMSVFSLMHFSQVVTWFVLTWNFGNFGYSAWWRVTYLSRLKPSNLYQTCTMWLILKVRLINLNLQCHLSNCTIDFICNFPLTVR